MEKAYVSSPLAYKEHLHREDYRKLEAFLEVVDNAVSILQNMRGNSVLPMSCEGISGFTRAYSGLFGDTDAVVDIHVDGSLHVGKNHARCYAVCDEIGRAHV